MIPDNKKIPDIKKHHIERQMMIDEKQLQMEQDKVKNLMQQEQEQLIQQIQNGKKHLYYIYSVSARSFKV